MKNIEEYKTYRSRVYSILKIDFGWNGCIPFKSFLDVDESLIEASFNDGGCINCLTQSLADDLNQHGAVFLPRLDGKPNSRFPNSFLSH